MITRGDLFIAALASSLCAQSAFTKTRGAEDFDFYFNWLGVICFAYWTIYFAWYALRNEQKKRQRQ